MDAREKRLVSDFRRLTDKQKAIVMETAACMADKGRARTIRVEPREGRIAKDA